MMQMQNREGLPSAILEDKRFFELKGSEKTSTPDGWNKPENWKYLDDIPEGKNFGFAVSGADSNYLFIDYDHVITDGKLCPFAEEIYQRVKQLGGTYTEISMSGSGLHQVVDLGDYADNFDSVNNNANEIIVQMDPTEYKNLPKAQRALIPKVEMFYRTGGRYIYLTGKNSSVVEVAKNEISAAIFRELLKIRSECHEKYRKTDSSSADPGGNEHLKADAKTLEKAKEALKFISAADYEPWIQMGQACKNIGLPFWIWDEWSRYANMITGELYPNYDPEETKEKWKTFRGASRWNAGTIFRKAKENGYEATSDDREQDWSYNLRAWGREHPGEKFDPLSVGWEAVREAGNRAREAEKRIDEGFTGHKDQQAAPGQIEASGTVSGAAAVPAASLSDVFGPDSLVDVISDYQNEIPEKEWTIEGICTKGECAIISGSSKSGKSYLMTNLAITAANGGKWLGRFQCSRSRVLYLNGENSLNDARERFHACFDALVVNPADCEQITMICADGILKSIDDLKSTLIDEIRRNNYSLVILDPLYCFFTGSEVDEKDTKSFVASIKEVCRETGAVIVCVHHHSKGGMMYSNASNRASGSGMLQRAFSTLLDVSEIDNRDGFLNLPEGLRAYEFTGQPRQAAGFRTNLLFDFPRWYEDQSEAVPDNALNKGRTAKARQNNKNIQKSTQIRALLGQAIYEAFRDRAKQDKHGEYVTSGDVADYFRHNGMDVSERTIQNKIDDGMAPGYQRDDRSGSRRLIRRKDWQQIPEERIPEDLRK